MSTLFDLVIAHRMTGAVYAAARLGIADFLAEGPHTAAEVAERTGTHERSVHRLLIGLVTLGLCRQVADQFELTEIGAPLAAGANPSVKDYVLFEGSFQWRWWGGFADTIRTGKTSAELAGLDNAFTEMAQSSEDVEIFNRAMVSLTRIITPAILAAYEFSGITRLMDVGGGFGELLTGILRAHRAMHGAIFDLPRCAEGARRQLAKAGVTDRAEFVAGDFFDSVPASADAIVMKSIIHDWNDELSVKILRNCRKALPAAGRLLLVERVMPDQPGNNADDRSNVFSDLNMLRGPGGAERTTTEYRDLFAATGFGNMRVFPAGRFSLIEATPV